MRFAGAIVALAFVVAGAWGQVPLGVPVGTPQTPKNGALPCQEGASVSGVAALLNVNRTTLYRALQD